MRWLVAAVSLAAVAGCGDIEHTVDAAPGDSIDASAGGGLDAAGGGAVDAAVPDAGRPDGRPFPSCEPAGDCTRGVPCGGGCCGPGEACHMGECQCGDGKACDVKGDTCEPFGPGMPGGCGVICCGASSPCPV
jgi:hypothetical protein